MVVPQCSNQNRETQIQQRKDGLQIRPICEEIINESSISYEISIQYKTPEKRSQNDSEEIFIRNHRKEKKIGFKNVLEISFNE